MVLSTWQCMGTLFVVTLSVYHIHRWAANNTPVSNTACTCELVYPRCPADGKARSKRA